MERPGTVQNPAAAFAELTADNNIQIRTIFPEPS